MHCIVSISLFVSLCLNFLDLKSQDSLEYPVFFETNKSYLDSVEKVNVVFLISQLSDFKIVSITVDGYCDDLGGNIFNNKLSYQRAQNVYIFLKKLCDSTTYISVNGNGEVKLSDKREINEQRINNRRVTLKIKYKKEVTSKYANSPLAIFLTNGKKGKRIDLNINFIPGRHFPVKESEPKLDTLYQILSTNNRKIIVEGHISGEPGDSDGLDEDTNEKKLSINRAKYVCDFLINKGIDKVRLKFKGMRAEVPASRGANFDRRVEIVLTE